MPPSTVCLIYTFPSSFAQPVMCITFWRHFSCSLLDFLPGTRCFSDSRGSLLSRAFPATDYSVYVSQWPILPSFSRIPVLSVTISQWISFSRQLSLSTVATNDDLPLFVILRTNIILPTLCFLPLRHVGAQPHQQCSRGAHVSTHSRHMARDCTTTSAYLATLHKLNKHSHHAMSLEVHDTLSSFYDQSSDMSSFSASHISPH